MSAPTKKPKPVAIPDRIVAEICNNWPKSDKGKIVPNDARLTSQRFEEVIKVAKEKGYSLESWKMNTVAYWGGDIWNCQECIIAVFVKA